MKKAYVSKAKAVIGQELYKKLADMSEASGLLYRLEGILDKGIKEMRYDMRDMQKLWESEVSSVYSDMYQMIQSKYVEGKDFWNESDLRDKFKLLRVLRGYEDSFEDYVLQMKVMIEQRMKEEAEWAAGEAERALEEEVRFVLDLFEFESKEKAIEFFKMQEFGEDFIAKAEELFDEE